MKQFYLFSILLILFLSSVSFHVNPQPLPSGADSVASKQNGLEDIIVEKYYIADTCNVTGTGDQSLPKGAVTYRIYVDIKPGYSLQAVYGSSTHLLFMASTTKFFNTDAGAKSGDRIDHNKINESTIAFDSWVAIGAATQSHFGILKSDDTDKSIITCKSLSESDGLVRGTIPELVTYGLDLNFFGNSMNASMFATDNGAWAVLGGVQGPTAANRILIAQLTTEGKLSFELNVQLGTPSGVYERYVAKNPEGSEIEFKRLIFSDDMN